MQSQEAETMVVVAVTHTVVTQVTGSFTPVRQATQELPRM
jgi:Flp pilus assembly pilin Flp